MKRFVRYLVGAAFAALVTSAQAQWENRDLALLGAAVVAHAADWSQTRQIHARDGIYERNPFLGPKPTPREVDRYFAATGLALIAGAHFLPRYRTAILGVWLTVEVLAVGNNLGLGLTVRL